ncbi:MAG: class I SAM-dependent methyltransferase [Candidatus Marinimicrobia bacterium]|nr:class I SAM-dependent methyltransferase [Candidatus Neomarinimicrobiota bacterium]
MQFFYAFFKAFKIDSILEIGTAIGYSALVMANHPNFKGQIITCDPSAHSLKRARANIEAYGMDNRIKTEKIGGIDYLKTCEKRFDLIFIDGRKEEYPEYYRLARQHLNFGGHILIDNLLWHGKVLDKNFKNDPRTEILRAFNVEFIQSKPEKAEIYDIGDGLGWVSVDKIHDKELRDMYIRERVKNEYFASFQT